jgi:hypothetical protein
MILRMRENPWRLMLAVNVAVLIGVFFYKITREPYVPYVHLLVDYHFGFTKRSVSLSRCFAEPSVSTKRTCHCWCSWPAHRSS